MSNSPRIDKIDRNYIMNGSKRYAQVSTAAQNMVSGTYTYEGIDQFAYKSSGSFTGTPTISRALSSPDLSVDYSSEFSANFTNTSSALYEGSPIESIFSRDFIGKKASFRASIYSAGCQTATINIYAADTKDDFSALTLIDSKSVSIVLGWNDVKFEDISISTLAVNGLFVEVKLDNSSVTGSTILHRVTKTKFSIGKEAQEFSYFGRDEVEELRFLERYLGKSYEVDSDVGTVSNIGSVYHIPPVTALRFTVELGIVMRSIPTVVLYSPISGSSGVIRVGGSDVAASSSPGIDSSKRFMVATNSATANANATWHWTADARLPL